MGEGYILLDYETLMQQHDLNGDPIDPVSHKKGKAVGHLKVITDNDEWATPWELFVKKIEHFKQVQLNKDYAEWKLFNPSFDYSASWINHKYPDYYDMEDNALTRAWLYDGFLNPPYTLVYEFIEKAIHEWNTRGIGLLITVFSKTGVAWWQDLVEPLRLSGDIIVEFHRGRIDFDEVDEVANVVWNSNHKVWNVTYKFVCQIHENQVLKNNYCKTCKSKVVGITVPKVTKSAPYDSAWIFLPPKQI